LTLEEFKYAFRKLGLRFQGARQAEFASARPSSFSLRLFRLGFFFLLDTARFNPFRFASAQDFLVAFSSSFSASAS
jgi:hypothetical protein